MADTGSEREFDVIVWGATGFVGQLIAEHLYLTYGAPESGKLRWAMAGRSKSKLESVRADLGADTVPLIVAESHDPYTLADMAKRTRVVCAAVGPFADYGSKLVEACIEQGTDYCDLTGETHWVRWMIDAYEAKARANNVRIVHCCGLDSLPSDLGTLFVQQQMQTTHGVYAPEVRMRITRAKNAELSGGTYASLLNAMDSVSKDKALRKHMMDPNALTPTDDPGKAPATDVNLPRYEPEAGGWVAPFMMAAVNTKVVRRSNALAGYPYGRDFKYGEGMATGRGVRGWIGSVVITTGLTVFMIFALIGPTRALLRRLLRKPGEGPSKEKRDGGSYEILFTARHPEDRARDVQATLSGDRDPGYGSTSRMIGECAVFLAQDEAARATPGGFWTPATCMGEGLIGRLGENAGVVLKPV